METVVKPIHSPGPAHPPGRGPVAPLAGSSGLSIDDIYYTLFRHKRKILLCTVTGLLAAGVAYLYLPPTFESHAKLFVRYVVSEGPSPVRTADDLVMKSPDMRGETIISSEEQILTSFDAVRQVAQTVGPERILAKAGGGNDPTMAAMVVSNGLTADAPKFSSVIDLTFRHSDPALVQPVLSEVIAQYLKRHVEIHRAAGLVGDFLAQETDQLRARLAQTEDDLRKARTKGEILSVEDAKKNYAAEIASIRQQIFATQADLAEHEAIVQQFTGGKVPGTPGSAAAASEAAAAPANVAIPTSVREEYAALADRLELLRNREHQALLSFTPENSLVKEIRAQLAEAIAKRQQIESTYPNLPDTLAMSRPAPDDANRRVSMALSAEMGRIIAFKAKLKTLNGQLESVRASAANLEKVEGTLEDLNRKKELEEANYRRYAASLEQSRINEALGSGKVSNISVIQNPSPPLRNNKNDLKIVGGLAIGGIGTGLAWAFLIELLLDRTVRRRNDVEKKLGLPLFLSIPKVNHTTRRTLPFLRPRALAAKNNNHDAAPTNGATPHVNGTELTLAPATENLRQFHETLRDRLIGYFERRGLTHRPKLVTVTGIRHAAGVTTTAAGLARCLSETGEGNVLLVDFTPEQRSAQQFYHGKPLCELDQLLTTRESGQVQEKLYVVSDSRSNELLSGVLPQRFRSLVPQLKASDFDYIIFDMPPVSQTSVTPRLAGFMDMVLLVIESEKTGLDVVQRATSLLSESATNIGVVLNKTKTYVPQMIMQEDLDN